MRQSRSDVLVALRAALRLVPAPLDFVRSPVEVVSLLFSFFGTWDVVQGVLFLHGPSETEVVTRHIFAPGQWSRVDVKDGEHSEAVLEYLRIEASITTAVMLAPDAKAVDKLRDDLDRAWRRCNESRRTWFPKTSSRRAVTAASPRQADPGPRPSRLRAPSASPCPSQP